MYSQKIAIVSKITNIIRNEQKDFLSSVEKFRSLPYQTKVTKYSAPADEDFVRRNHFKTKSPLLKIVTGFDNYHKIAIHDHVHVPKFRHM